MNSYEITMSRLSFLIIFLSAFQSANGQPCKIVKPGMTKSEVLKLAGPPTEIDTVFIDKGQDTGRKIIEVWQYGDPAMYGNQRVKFTGNVVDSNVIADGKKYDELMLAFQHGEFTESELFKRINDMNEKLCK
jgi:hypothetical protein